MTIKVVKPHGPAKIVIRETDGTLKVVDFQDKQQSDSLRERLGPLMQGDRKWVAVDPCVPSFPEGAILKGVRVEKIEGDGVSISWQEELPLTEEEEVLAKEGIARVTKVLELDEEE